jgi:Ni,Fe-hydrogenase III large subunit
MLTLRERLRDLNRRLTGNRWLRGLIRPGGVTLAPGLPASDLIAELRAVVDEFITLAVAVTESPACRDRLIGCGYLSADEARRAGASGVIRRASGARDHDWRLRHPFAPYRQPEIQAEIAGTVGEDAEDAPSEPRGAQEGIAPRRIHLLPSHLAGDVFARFVLRVAETETSARLVARLLKDVAAPATPEPAAFSRALESSPAYQLGYGCAEGARGAVGFCIITGAGELPLRCKPFGPSEAALRCLSAAASLRRVDGVMRGDILGDVPLDNVSMNASLAECAG